jgi:hypothetical protein
MPTIAKPEDLETPEMLAFLEAEMSKANRLFSFMGLKPPFKKIKKCGK